ncbi:serine protease [uncultured Roseobacter sp.]|uniref:S1 family peptidase n=1 Tax=uncultured Roseobacter sp. TaxID=114847 RepID=UPI0026352CA0|nr:serine protease [uncultured Roseobacter sp.]
MLSVRAGHNHICVRRIFVRFFTAVFLSVTVLVSQVLAIEARQPVKYHAAVLNGAVTGSAFSVSEGMAVTNAHVIGAKRAGDTVYLMVPDRPRISARVVAISPLMDLAVLSVADAVLPVTPFGSARDGRGARVYAVGVVAASGSPRRQVTATGRVSSALQTVRPFGRGFIVSMPGVRHGFSGGPVFDTRGQLVGMVAALRPGTSGNPAARDAFILSAEDIRREVQRLTRRAGR